MSGQDFRPAARAGSGAALLTVALGVVLAGRRMGGTDNWCAALGSKPSEGVAVLLCEEAGLRDFAQATYPAQVCR
jgi:hypothetical protein